jgi:hypothetical protein
MRLAAGVIALLLCVLADADAAQLIVVSPVMVKGEPAMRAGPKGESPAPVLMPSPQPALVTAIQKEATRGTLAFMLDLDARAQRLVSPKSAAVTYVALSANEGPSAPAFWLATSANAQEWHTEPYARIVTDAASVADGRFEEACAHELGYLLLRRLAPALPAGRVPATHSALGVTDYASAFSEGFALHFQALARQLTQNRRLKAFDAGIGYQPFSSFEHETVERAMSVRGVRENLFIQRDVPAGSEAIELKNGQQMMSSAGVVATLFYQLMLRSADDSKALPARYDELLTSLRALNRTLNGARPTQSTPLFLKLAQLHVSVHPQDKHYWVSTIVGVTYGATVSNQRARNVAELDRLVERAEKDPARLDDGLGPELWLQVERPSGVEAINLNTAEKEALVRVLDFEPTFAERVLVNRGLRGPFPSIAEFARRFDLSDLQRARLLAARLTAK